MNQCIDEEWKQFLYSQTKNSAISYREPSKPPPKKIDISNSLNQINQFTIANTKSNFVKSNNIVDETTDLLTENTIPKCSELNISTITKVLFLNSEIDIGEIFWNIPIIEYWKPIAGIVKKQMKIVSKTLDDFAKYNKRLECIEYYNELILKQINNPNARSIKFKDERKITIGMSKKDIMNERSKDKNAFYNCFAMILRFNYEGNFREIHVKVFNTGKLEIPGIINNKLLDIVKEFVLQIIQPHISTELFFIDIENCKEDDNILINSNFKCGFYINREKIMGILKSDEYGIESTMDSCNYPGVKCTFYFNNEYGFDKMLQTGKINIEDRHMKMSELCKNKKYTKVSFAIFRTGSCLISGHCSDLIVFFVYEFIKNILTTEYENINIATAEKMGKLKKPKMRKKTISLSSEYFNSNQ